MMPSEQIESVKCKVGRRMSSLELDLLAYKFFVEAQGKGIDADRDVQSPLSRKISGGVSL